MKNSQFDDRFLARWLDDTLTSNEMQEFEASDDYLAFNDIIRGVERFEPLPPFNAEAKFALLKERLVSFDERKSAIRSMPKVRKLIPNWALSIAALLVLGLGIGYFLNNRDITMTTAIGEKTTIALPDNSEVVLNSGSSLKFNKGSFDTNRSLELDGEGLFKVAKGSEFTVTTTDGTITVLGTEFNVNKRKNHFEVICYEGSVRVVYQMKSYTLGAGEAVRILDNEKPETFEVSDDFPAWIQDQSSFRSTPLHLVIDELERQFEIRIKPNNVDLEKKYTGTFRHDNLGNALKTVFAPMNIQYVFESENIIALK